jgi:succinyl-CoA synthetase beta subunit/citryl-CoA synthetase large subunit
MRLLEYQSKALLASFGLKLTAPTVVESAEAAVRAFEALKGTAVLKAQVPFGGRGKAGGIKFVESADQARIMADELLGMDLRGALVKEITVEPRVSAAQEFYVGITWDTSAKLPVAIVSATGGLDVEQSDGRNLARKKFDPRLGLMPFEGRQLAGQIGLTGKTLVGLGNVLATLARAFLAIDGLTVEINPLVLTEEGSLLGLDARVEIDEDAENRQKARLEALGSLEPTVAGREPTEIERKARIIDNMDHRGVAGRVVEFDGNLALLIGGGGASLTVFDAIRRYGGKPANYCEIGGNPTEEKIAALTELILSKPGVEKLAVVMNVVNNTRADVIARGVLQGITAKGADPAETIVVFRIPGSWENEAVALLADAGVKALGREFSLDQCARIAVESMGVYVT